MALKINRSPDALREGISFTADGVEGAIYPRWTHIIDSVVVVSDYGAESAFMDNVNAFPSAGAHLSRDPRLLLQSLRWLLHSIGVDTGANLRRFEQDVGAAQVEFAELYDTHIHHGLEVIA
ncbi:MAG: hypothetical protein QM496_16585 [Verrucomicrobiota bacterium]